MTEFTPDTLVGALWDGLSTPPVPHVLSAYAQRTAMVLRAMGGAPHGVYALLIDPEGAQVPLLFGEPLDGRILSGRTAHDALSSLKGPLLETLGTPIHVQLEGMMLRALPARAVLGYAIPTKRAEKRHEEFIWKLADAATALGMPVYALIAVPREGDVGIVGSSELPESEDASITAALEMGIGRAVQHPGPKGDRIR